VGIIYLVFPFIVKQREFIPHSFFGNLILFERAMDGETGALPSFHVIWAFISARYFSKSNMRLKWLRYLLSVLISVSCITTSSHSILDVIGGICTFIVIAYRTQIWRFIRLQSERLSNSRKEWRWGPARIINHDFYGGGAGFTGILLAGFFLGPQDAVVGFVIMLFVIVGAGLWAQLIEGS
jgi:hypothetical protein